MTASQDTESPLPGPEDVAGSSEQPTTSSGDHNTVYTTVQSAVFENAVFGFQTQAAERPARATGKLPTSEVDEAIRGFVAPDCYTVAVSALTECRFVVLYGPTGTGKRTAAMHLLRDRTEEQLISLSPQLSIAELANRKYEPTGYAIFDHSVEFDSAQHAQNGFELGRLRDRLAESNAYLVVTTGGKPRTSSDVLRSVSWSGPDPIAVVESRLSTPLTADVRATLRTLLTDTASSMRDLTDLADRLAGDMSLDEAVGHLDITARKAVADWFDKQPERRPVAEVTALCFALGADVRTFETMLVSFERRLGEHMPEPQATVDVPPETGLRQVRHARNRPDSLIVRERGESADGLGTGMRFRSSGYQRHVLGMLCDRMDVEFWNAVRVWLDDVDIGSDHSRPLVADGLTTLAEVAFDEAFDVLERWSAGARGRNGQIVAAIVLSSMSYRDHLAPRALQIATTWITRKNGARQWVAAVAFGNALGVRYPHEAIARLWTLCAQAHAAQRDMTPIIGMLFTDLVVEAGDPGIVLRTITKAAGRQGAARNMSRRQIAIAAGTAILSARDVHGRTAVSLFLERFPDKTAEIAGLLACVLGNRPTRIEAIRAIRRALQDLVKHTDRPETIAHRLGDALAAEMTISEGEQLKAEIARVRTQRGRTDSDKTAAALAALLARLERNTPDNKETQ